MQSDTIMSVSEMKVELSFLAGTTMRPFNRNVLKQYFHMVVLCKVAMVVDFVWLLHVVNGRKHLSCI